MNIADNHSVGTYCCGRLRRRRKQTMPTTTQTTSRRNPTTAGTAIATVAALLTVTSHPHQTGNELVHNEV